MAATPTMAVAAAVTVRLDSLQAAVHQSPYATTLLALFVGWLLARTRLAAMDRARAVGY